MEASADDQPAPPAAWSPVPGGSPRPAHTSAPARSLAASLHAVDRSVWLPMSRRQQQRWPPRVRLASPSARRRRSEDFAGRNDKRLVLIAHPRRRTETRRTMATYLAFHEVDDV